MSASERTIASSCRPSKLGVCDEHWIAACRLVRVARAHTTVGLPSGMVEQTPNGSTRRAVPRQDRNKGTGARPFSRLSRVPYLRLIAGAIGSVARSTQESPHSSASVDWLSATGRSSASGGSATATSRCASAAARRSSSLGSPSSNPQGCERSSRIGGLPVSVPGRANR